MALHDWITLLSCAGHLGLALLVVLRGGGSPLQRPLVLLCIDFFAFNAADIAGHFSRARGWVYFDLTSASLGPAVTLHFMAAFVGQTRRLRRVVALAYLAFGALAAVCFLSFFSPSARDFAGSTAWAKVLLAGSLPLLGFMTALLLSHLRRSTSALERGRSYLVLAAFVFGAVGCLSDVIADTQVAVPRLGPAGTLVSTLLLAVVALRFHLLERRVSSLLLLSTLAIGALQVLAYLAVYRFLGDNQAMLILGTVTVTLAIVPVAREVARTFAAHRERLEHLATLGRFSAQMAHDLRNPLAAIKGAAQFLEEELARGRPLAGKAEYLRLIVEQTERLDRVVSDYQRLGRVEAALEPRDLNEVVRGVLAPQTLAAPEGVVIRAELGDGLPACRVDRDLLAGALENLVRNAFEAMPGGGTLTVSTLQRSMRRAPRDGDSGGDDGGHGLEAGGYLQISVADTGAGMDPRVSERAFDDFYTTKAQGSGLGLSFVRRVAEAHGGDVSLASREGRGTTVRLRLRVA